MIGKIVEHILEAGFDVWVHQQKTVMDTPMLMLCISKTVGEESVSVDWALLPEHQLRFPEVLLMDECERRLQLLRDEIAKRESEGPHD